MTNRAPAALLKDAPEFALSGADLLWDKKRTMAVRVVDADP
jgi:hypothetical protein